MPYPTPKSALLKLSLTVAFSSAALPAQAQRIVALPGTSVLSGDPIQLRLLGVPAGSQVTVHSRRALLNDDGEPRSHEAQARFKADAKGRVDLSTQPPMHGNHGNHGNHGTYGTHGTHGSDQGADVRGLFWSMTPSEAGEAGEAADPQTMKLGPDTEVTLTARIDGKVVATQVINLLSADPRLETTQVAEFEGAQLVSLPGKAKRPAIIVLGGSEGGSYTARLIAPKFASHGYAVLGLPYYSPSGYSANGPTPPELPTLPAAFADIPVDRLQQARDRLARQPNVDASRIAVYGVSKGAEFALIASTRMTWIKAVVAVVPSDVVWEGWGPGAEKGNRPSFAWKGEPLAYVPYLGFAAEFDGYRTNTPVIVRRPQDRGRAANPDRVAAARIPVERYAGPLLLVAGGDDQLWDSGGMASNIATARAQSPKQALRHRQVTQALIYADAGHLLSGDGWRPTTQYNVSLSKVGGTPEGNAHAQADAWPKTLAFLKRHLSLKLDSEPAPR